MTNYRSHRQNVTAIKKLGVLIKTANAADQQNVCSEG
jgi:hypothetical protein